MVRPKAANGFERARLMVKSTIPLRPDFRNLWFEVHLNCAQLHRLRLASTVQRSRRAGIALGRKAATYRLLAGYSRAVGVRRSAVGQMAQPTAAAAIREPPPTLKQPSTLVDERSMYKFLLFPTSKALRLAA